MTRFHGRVGYGATVEDSPGVFVDHIVERAYYGDLIRNSRTLSEGDSLNQDISVSHTVSIVADPYAFAHFFAIRYVIWGGVYWTAREVEVRYPRLELRLGEVYNGPKAGAPVSP